MAFRRNIFTGELEEYAAVGGRQIIHRIAAHYDPKKTGDFRFKLTALGVGPEDIPRAMEHDKKHGVPTEYTPDGDPIITSIRHMEAYDRINGFDSETYKAGQAAYEAENGEYA